MSHGDGAVKSRCGAGRLSPALPPLWLFTDPGRGPLLPALRGLPRGLCGVVFRHDGVPGRLALLRAVARTCRARRLALSVAGGGPVPPGAGRHLRGGRGARAGVWATASAHGLADLVRARRAGARCAFLSPAFPTGSHPGAAGLGAVRWAAMAGRAGLPVLALGGMDGRRARRLLRRAVGVGAIGALSR